MRAQLAFVGLICAAALSSATLLLDRPADALRSTGRPTVTPAVSVTRTLGTGAVLFSPNHRYAARMLATGALVVTDRDRLIFTTRTTGRKASVTVQADGNLVLRSAGKALWQAATIGSGHHNQLLLSDDGQLQLVSGNGVVWSSRFGNRCSANRAAHLFLVSVGAQHGWACSGSNQLLSPAVTTGAVSNGDATPVGTWRIQAKQRNRYLYPADGGRYYVQYWMPYDGEFGMHDAAWQRFPYGGGQYRTQGSHGCVHVPPNAMAWLYSWAPVGTTVAIRA